jgi:hypothetical protein
MNGKRCTVVEVGPVGSELDNRAIGFYGSQQKLGEKAGLQAENKQIKTM